MEPYEKNGLKFRMRGSDEFLILTENATVKKLKELQIKNLEINFTSGYNPGNLLFLSELGFIESISIVGQDKMDLSGLYYLPNLKLLNMTGDFGEVIDFEKFPLLKHCQVFWSPKIRNLSRLPLLEYLVLHRYKNNDLKEFRDLSALKDLSLTQSTITSLSGIENLKRLEKLDLFQLRKLTSLEGIDKLTLLKRLDVESCTSIRDIGLMKYLINLESLGMHDCKEIESIKPFRDLHKLQIIYLTGNTNIVDGDLTPLLNRKDAAIAPRKHYSHKPDEIDKINGTVRPKQTWDW